MKKQIFGLVAVCSLAAAATAFAGRGDGIVNGPHDMRTYNYVDSNDRACAFCHTPHHANLATGAANTETYMPLWSRKADTKLFNVAYQSTTINAAELLDGSDKAVGPTRLCMSCHDGTIAPDQHYGNTVAGTAAPLTSDLLPGDGYGAGVGAGNGLQNDHPVGFDYIAVAGGPAVGNSPSAAQLLAAKTDTTIDPWIRDAAATYNGNTGITIAERLYVDANTGKSFMTCATCHDVHNKKNNYATSGPEPVNYLVLSPQSGSALCLTCHIK